MSHVTDMLGQTIQVGDLVSYVTEDNRFNPKGHAVQFGKVTRVDRSFQKEAVVSVIPFPTTYRHEMLGIDVDRMPYLLESNHVIQVNNYAREIQEKWPDESWS